MMFRRKIAIKKSLKKVSQEKKARYFNFIRFAILFIYKLEAYLNLKLFKMSFEI
jgi:hypothetical protein